MSNKIAITTSSFGKVSDEPIELVKASGLEYQCNTFGRTLKNTEIVELLADCTAVIAGTERYDQNVLDQLPNLKIISRCGVGIDSIDLDHAQAQGIKIFNTPDGPTLAVAELVIGLALNVLRQISIMDREMRSGQWQKRMGNLFSGKTVGIFGFGRIGQAVAQLSRALGAEIIYYDPFVEVNDQNYKKIEQATLWQTADIVSIHLPYNDETKNSIGSAEFEQIQKGLYLINCARGGIVDENALCEALKNNKIKGAAIDVFDQEPYDGALKEFEQVILTPHIGSYAQEARMHMEIAAVNNLIQGLKEIE